MSEEFDQENQPRGFLGDVRNVKHNGAASLAELREFIGSLKGRKPQEIMSEVASNGLVRGMVMSTVGFLVILLVFTAIPYLMADEEPVVQKEETPAVSSSKDQASENTNDRNQAEDVSRSNASGNNGSGNNGSGEQTGNAAINKMGIGETLEADPDKNPLGDKFNELLEGVK